MKARIVRFDSLRKGGFYLRKSPFIGPRGGLYADVAHKIPYNKKEHGAVKPSKCPRCKGVSHIISRQKTIGGKAEVSASPCRTCNPKGKIKLDPKKVAAAGLPMPKAKKVARRAPPERDQPAQKHQMKLDYDRKEDTRQMSMFKAGIITYGELCKALSGSPFKLHGSLKFQGLDIAIENRKGSKRHWTDETGQKGHTVMVHPYGYIRGVEGADGDEVDVYVGPDKKSELVFIVNQRAIQDPRKFDEHKIMLGFSSEAAAREGYLKHYAPRSLGKRLLGTMRTWSMERFKRWLDKRGAHKAPVRKAFVVPR